MKQRILLTGGSGFVGQNLKKELLWSSHSDIFTPTREVCDLTSQSSVKFMFDRVKPDVVIHAAGTVGGIQANKDNPGKFMYENLIMGTNVIHQSMLSKVGKFILLGTVCSYPKFTPVPFKEGDLWNGYPEETNAPYGIAKRTLMELLINYNKEYGLNGINLVPVNMYGPYDHFNLDTSHVIPALILKVERAIREKSKQITVWGTGKATREFLYVKDFVKSVELALRSNPGPQPINIGTGSEISIQDLVQGIVSIAGYGGEILYDTTKPDGQPRRCLDTSEAKNKLGFEAQTTLKEGLKLTIDWFRTQ